MPQYVTGLGIRTGDPATTGNASDAPVRGQNVPGWHRAQALKRAVDLRLL
jgi:hypothetical protein